MAASIIGSPPRRATARKPAPAGDEMPSAIAAADMDCPVPPATLRLLVVVDPAEPAPLDGADLLARGLGGLRERSRMGAAERAALDFVAALGPLDAAALASIVDEAPPQPTLLLAAQGKAAELAADRRFAEAATLLAALTGFSGGLFDGWLGLAAVALSLGRPEDAGLFAETAVASGLKHPTAYRILGLARLLRGDRRAAQASLALSARLARTDPRFRDDLRIAQRVLLQMHLS